MRIGIISDTHDNIWRLDEALSYLQDTDAVLHCGDLISPFMIHRLGKRLGNKPLHMIWGNNDGDKLALTKAAGEYSNITLHGDFAELTLDSVRIAIHHYPEVGKTLAKCDHYDLVCYGHDHKPYREMVGNTMLINPGEVMGLNGSATLAIYDTGPRRVETFRFWQG